MTDRLPPHSVEAEASVLGAIMLDNTAADLVELALREEHFYNDANRVIYRAMRMLRMFSTGVARPRDCR